MSTTKETVEALAKRLGVDPAEGNVTPEDNEHVANLLQLYAEATRTYGEKAGLSPDDHVVMLASIRLLAGNIAFATRRVSDFPALVNLAVDAACHDVKASVPGYVTRLDELKGKI